MKSIYYILIYSALLCVGALTGCSSSQNSTNGATYSKTYNGSMVTVYEDEYKIHMPTVFPGPIVTFHIVNDGKMDHSFKIKGNGVDQELPSHISPGMSADMNANLPAGTYEVICPLLGHADLGMRLTVTVQ
jgi:uncharacterized cupredoxin-like copper-binding protein